MENEHRTDQGSMDPQFPSEQAQPAQPGQQSQQFQAAPAQPDHGQHSAYAVQPALGGQPGPATDQNAQNVQLNYILSIFFGVIPAAIFLFTDAGKNPAERRYHAYNMNFQILRAIVGLASFIPFIGLLFTLVAIAMLVLDIMATVKVADAVRRGEGDQFKVNVDWVK